jgi:excisionase family DNA binding protein
MGTTNDARTTPGAAADVTGDMSVEPTELSTDLTVGSMLRVKEAAALLGVSPSLVYVLCAAGKIRHERHGVGRGTIRIRSEALEEYRKTAEAVPVAPALVHIKRR